jgi:hypothetical protein
VTLLVEHADVVELCDYALMMAAIERGLAEEANGTLIMPARVNLPMRSGHFRLMPASWASRCSTGCPATERGIW